MANEVVGRFEKGEPYNCRMLEAASGMMEEYVTKKAEALWIDPTKWEAPDEAGTLGLAGLGFAMLSAVHCTLEQLLFRLFQGFSIYGVALAQEPICGDGAVVLQGSEM